MTETALPTLRWGIVGCGLISARFVQDLCLIREDASAKHVVQAIGSSSKHKGYTFVSNNCSSHEPNVYDSYHDVYNDPQVDVVYIGTPHVFHCENALAAIAAGKHVLCEKPITMKTQDAQRLVNAARKKGVFLMEAVWTRFFPLTQTLEKLLHEQKVIGDISSVYINFGSYMPISEAEPSKRTASKTLGAGALLDIGIYTLTWASIILDKSPSRDHHRQPELSASMLFASETDANKKIDEQVAMVLKYPDIKAQAICTASLLYKLGEQFGRIEGSKGTIIICGQAPSKPLSLIIRVKGEKESCVEADMTGWGFFYEADAVARDITASRTENDVCSLMDTLTIMRRMDAMRAMCGLSYPGDEI